MPPLYPVRLRVVEARGSLGTRHAAMVIGMFNCVAVACRPSVSAVCSNVVYCVQLMTLESSIYVAWLERKRRKVLLVPTRVSRVYRTVHYSLDRGTRR